MNKFYRIATLASFAAVSLLSACAGGGYANNNVAGGLGSNVAGGAYNNTLSAVEGALLNSVTQNMAGSVLNGQIASQISPVDQNFRLQQLGSMVQSGAVNQTQQWVNPQTGSTIALNPVGQASVHPQTQQQCRNMQEVVTLQNGQSITENRQACLNPQTGQWALIQ